jgi:polar amino acid transport system substrate-binding protein
MRRGKLFGWIVLIAALALVTAACSSGGGGGSTTSASATAEQDMLARILASGKLRVSSDNKYPPQSSLNDETGQWEGFDIDVATEIATRLGVKAEFIDTPWKEIISGNWNDRWDISVGSMTITPERAKVLYFTPPYYYTPAGFAVYKTNTTIKSAADLTGKTVGVCGDCTYEYYLRGTLEIPDYPLDFQVQGADIVTYETDLLAIEDLSLGDGARLDAAFSAIPTLQGAIDAGKPIKIVGPPLYYEPLGIGIDRAAPLDATSLLEKLSQIVADMHADGTLTELSMKWYGTDLTVEQGATAVQTGATAAQTGA